MGNKTSTEVNSVVALYVTCQLKTFNSIEGVSHFFQNIHV